MRRDVFQAIADPIRREIIEMVSGNPLTINDIASNFEISRPAISKHIKILKECGIITTKKEGVKHYCFINAENLIPAFMWLDQYKNLWEDRIDSFENHLMNLKNK